MGKITIVTELLMKTVAAVLQVKNELATLVLRKQKVRVFAERESKLVHTPEFGDHAKAKCFPNRKFAMD